MAMLVRIALHPSELFHHDLQSCNVVVFDVLRATTTIVTALAHGAAEVRAFAEVDEARAAAAAYAGLRLLAGERGCLPPPGFDLGNSPLDYTPDRVRGTTIFLSTTNGTRAIKACQSARRTYVASLCNINATARRLAQQAEDVVLVCAGVDGAPGGEDVDGAATLAHAIQALRPDVQVDTALSRLLSSHSWRDLSPEQGLTRLIDSPGGINLRKVGLMADVEFCAAVDRFGLIARVTHRPGYAAIRPD